MLSLFFIIFAFTIQVSITSEHSANLKPDELKAFNDLCTFYDGCNCVAKKGYRFLFFCPKTNIEKPSVIVTFFSRKKLFQPHIDIDVFTENSYFNPVRYLNYTTHISITCKTQDVKIRISPHIHLFSQILKGRQLGPFNHLIAGAEVNNCTLYEKYQTFSWKNTFYPNESSNEYEHIRSLVLRNVTNVRDYVLNSTYYWSLILSDMDLNGRLHLINPNAVDLILNRNNLTTLDGLKLNGTTRYLQINNFIDNITSYENIASAKLLIIKDSNIRRIPATTFINKNSSLIHIHIESINLRSIESGAFVFLHLKKKLETVVIINPHKRLEYLPENVFGAGILKLTLQCGLRHIDRGVFGGDSDLTDIDLSHNHLVEIPVGIFDNFIYLKSINLSYNKIKAVKEYYFHLDKNNIGFNMLDLSNNLITRWAR